jgi:hypothetical protein
MKAPEIRQQLHDYIDVMDTKKLKALYTLIEDDIKVNTDDIWDNDEFVNELQRRSASVMDGTAKTSTWEEVQKNARKALAEKKRKNAA